VVYVVLFLITLYDLIIARTIFSQVLIAMIIGLVAGIVSARMYKITWDSDEAEVVGRIDAYGVVVLVLFILFELNRNRIAELFAGGASLGSIGFVLITSALFGRIFGTARSILRVLNDEKII